MTGTNRQVLTNDDLLKWLQEIIDGHSAPHDRGVTRLATECKAEIERLSAALLWIASMADEDNEWDGVDRFRTARQKAIDAVGPASEPDDGYTQAYADQMRTALLRISTCSSLDEIATLAFNGLNDLPVKSAPVPASAHCIDCGGAREDHDDLSTFRPALKSGGGQ